MTWKRDKLIPKNEADCIWKFYLFAALSAVGPLVYFGGLIYMITLLFVTTFMLAVFVPPTRITSRCIGIK